MAHIKISRLLSLFAFFALLTCFSIQANAQTAETPTATPQPPAPTMTPAPTFTQAPTPLPGEPTHTPMPTATAVAETPTATPIGNQPPRVAASQTRLLVGSDSSAVLLVGAEDPDGDNVSLTVSPSTAGDFITSTQIGRFFTGSYLIDGSKLSIGSNVITFHFFDNGSPSQSADIEVTVIVQQRDFDEVVIGQGYGGSTNVTYRTVDLRADLDSNGLYDIRDLLGVVSSWNAMPQLFENFVGGGTDREVHLAVGDINNDGEPELVTTFGPITSEAVANSANMFIMRNDRGRVLFPPFGGVFPTESIGETINNPKGEMFAAVGNFIGSATNKQIAFTQGLGGSGSLRILQYNGQNDFSAPRNTWDIVGQLYGGSIPSLNVESGLALSDAFSGALTQNANGGVTLAAADLDGDSLDELIVGQTSSATSRGTIQVLDLGEPNPLVSNVVFDARYVEYNAFDVLEPFLGDFRGDGGVNIAAGDIDGDGSPEVMITSRGDSSQTATAKNWVLLLRPIVQNNQVTGFSILPGGLLAAFTQPEGANPSNALSIGVGEFSGLPGDGKEIVVGSSAIVDYDGFNATVSLGAPQTLYVILKVNFADDGSVTGATNIVFNGRAEGFGAFQGSFEPSSGAVNVAGFNALDPNEF